MIKCTEKVLFILGLEVLFMDNLRIIEFKEMLLCAVVIIKFILENGNIQGLKGRVLFIILKNASGFFKNAFKEKLLVF